MDGWVDSGGLGWTGQLRFMLMYKFTKVRVVLAEHRPKNFRHFLWVRAQENKSQTVKLAFHA